MIDEVHLDLGAHLRRDFLPVRLVLFGQNDVFHTKSDGGQHLFLHATDAHHAPAQTDFARHRGIRATAVVRAARLVPRRLPRLRSAHLSASPRRNMNVDVVFGSIGQIKAEFVRLAAQITKRGLGAFFHHVAQRAGEENHLCPACGKLR